MDDLKKQCLHYFQKAGFKRLMQALYEKYRSLGHLGGTIVIKQLHEVEKQDLNGLLRMDLSSQNDLRIHVSKLEKLVADTKFGVFSLEDIVVQYFGESLTSKKEQLQIALQKQDQFFNELFDQFENSKGALWLQRVRKEKTGIYLTLQQRYSQDQQLLRQQLSHVMKALNHLPVYEGTQMRLPVFSSVITQDPHAFDEQRDEIGMLLHGICTLMQLPYHAGMNAEERMEVLYAAGIQKDDISNFTTVYQMYAYHGEEELIGWHAFAQQQQPLQVSLMNLNEVTRLQAAAYVYVVENPSVFSALVECCRAHHRNDISLICTYGQLRISSLLILQHLTRNQVTFSYAGDFDPEGLQIAQKLCKRYPLQCRLWRYQKEDYDLAVSKKEIIGQRLRKLESITEAQLLPMKACLLQEKHCAYQEQLINRYCQDLLALPIK